MDARERATNRTRTRVCIARMHVARLDRARRAGCDEVGGLIFDLLSRRRRVVERVTSGVSFCTKLVLHKDNLKMQNRKLIVRGGVTARSRPCLRPACLATLCKTGKNTGSHGFGCDQHWWGSR